MLKLLTPITLLIFSPIATAQMIVPHDPGECEVSVIDTLDGDAFSDGIPLAQGFSDGSPAQGEFAIPDGDFCSQYTLAGTDAGWDDTMILYFGEGARDYRALIEQAVNMWNLALRKPGQDPVIRIERTRSPSLYTLPVRFWDRRDAESDTNVRDGQSVIYFKDGGRNSSRGYTKILSLYNQIKEADIYLNTVDEEEYGSNLAFTQEIFNLDGEHGVYAYINPTFTVILHEIGHAIGLDHIPVSGNAMTRDFKIGIIDQWAAPLNLFVITQLAIKRRHYASMHPSQLQFVDRHDEVYPYMSVWGENLLSRLELFTETAKLGEQDKMALMCIYKY